MTKAEERESCVTNGWQILVFSWKQLHASHHTRSTSARLTVTPQTRFKTASIESAGQQISSLSKFPAVSSLATLFAAQQISSRFPAIFEVVDSTSGRKHVQAQPRFSKNVVSSCCNELYRLTVEQISSRFEASADFQQISSRNDATCLKRAYGVSAHLLKLKWRKDSQASIRIAYKLER